MLLTVQPRLLRRTPGSSRERSRDKLRRFVHLTGCPVPPDLQLTPPTGHKRVLAALTLENRIHPCVSDLRCNCVTMRQDERHLSLGAGTVMVQDVDAKTRSTRNAHQLMQLLRYCISLAAAGSKRVVQVASLPDTNTHAGRGWRRWWVCQGTYCPMRRLVCDPSVSTCGCRCVQQSTTAVSSRRSSSTTYASRQYLERASRRHRTLKRGRP